MTYYYFQKIRIPEWGCNNEWIIIFEQGCMGKPVCLLDKESMQRLIREWGESEEKR